MINMSYRWIFLINIRNDNKKLMKKFDYIEKSVAEKMTEFELKTYGEMGYELVVFSDSGLLGDDGRYYYIFKKEMSGVLYS